MKNATSLLNIGHSGLIAARKRLATSGHNISNANTEGFSRQRAPQETTTPLGQGDIIIGTGTRIARVERMHDKYLEKRLGDSITEHSFYQERGHQLAEVEKIFNEIDIAGFTSLLNKFFNSFRELSKQPDNQALKTIIRENARQLTRGFQKIKKELNQMQFSMDQKVLGSIDDINLLMHQIAKLNIKITQIEGEGGESGDLRDQRDLKIRELSQFLELNVYEDNQGQYTVNAIGVGSLVSSGHVQELSGQKSSDSQSYIPGGAEVYFKDRPSHAISGRLSRGKLRGILDARDTELKSLQKRIDDLAFVLVNSVNTIHRKGFSYQGHGLQELSGIDFFAPLSSSYEAAEHFKLSDYIERDEQNIATAQQRGSPGDNRVALAIAGLQYAKLLDNGMSTLEDFYLKGIGKVGAETRASRVNEEQSLGILAQNKALRERVAGVSLDEETADMIRFQHAFDASARVMSVADEMFKTVLGIKKL